jgi:hypothetical protein
LPSRSLALNATLTTPSRQAIPPSLSCSPTYRAFEPSSLRALQPSSPRALAAFFDRSIRQSPSPVAAAMPTAGLKTIIALSFVLAVGFLLVILSCALWHNYFPLLVVATYVIAPLPNWICGRASNPDDFMESSSSAVIDFGRFLTGFLVVMGIGMSPPSPRPNVVQDTWAWLLTQRTASSSACCARSLRPHFLVRHGHVHHRWPSYLRHHHKFHYVFPGG